MNSLNPINVPLSTSKHCQKFERAGLPLLFVLMRFDGLLASSFRVQLKAFRLCHNVSGINPMPFVPTILTLPRFLIYFISSVQFELIYFLFGIFWTLNIELIRILPLGCLLHFKFIQRWLWLQIQSHLSYIICGLRVSI